MPLDLTKVTPLYQDRISQLITQMGKDSLLVLEKTVTNMSDSEFDKLRGGKNSRKPTYKINNEITIVENSTRVKGLIKWNPKDTEDFDVRIEKGKNIIRIKTFIENVPDMLRAHYLIPNVDVEPLVNPSRYKMLKTPQPIGLQYDIFAITYWVEV